jgi:hypothetical protein
LRPASGHGGTLPLADLAAECRGGSAVLIGGALEDGHAKIGLDAPNGPLLIAGSPAIGQFRARSLCE